MKKVLAIDFGTSRIGLAVSRFDLAEPLKIVKNNEQTIGQIRNIVEQEKIELSLVGLSENKMAQRTKDFAKKLVAEITIPLEFVDETLSSKNVHQKLADSPMKLKKKQGPIDHYAAAEFLQEWLDIN